MNRQKKSSWKIIPLSPLWRYMPKKVDYVAVNITFLLVSLIPVNISAFQVPTPIKETSDTISERKENNFEENLKPESNKSSEKTNRDGVQLLPPVLPINFEDDEFKSIAKGMLIRHKSKEVFFVSLRDLKDKVNINDSVYILNETFDGILAAANVEKIHKKKPVVTIRLEQKPAKDLFLKLKKGKLAVVKQSDIFSFIELFKNGPYDTAKIQKNRRENAKQLYSGVTFTDQVKVVKNKYLAAYNKDTRLKKGDQVFILTKDEKGIQFAGEVRTLKKEGEIAIIEVNLRSAKPEVILKKIVRTKMPITAQKAVFKRLDYHSAGPIIPGKEIKRVIKTDSGEDTDHSETEKPEITKQPQKMDNNKSNSAPIEEKIHPHRYQISFIQQRNSNLSIGLVTGGDFKVNQYINGFRAELYLPTWLKNYGDVGISIEKDLTLRSTYNIERQDELGGSQSISLNSDFTSASLIYRYTFTLEPLTDLKFHIYPIFTKNNSINISESGIDPGGDFQIIQKSPRISLYLTSNLLDSIVISFGLNSSIGEKITITQNNTSDITSAADNFVAELRAGYITQPLLEHIRLSFLSTISYHKQSIDEDNFSTISEFYSKPDPSYGFSLGLIYQ